jgi:uncharacterized Zn-binding protein involved in type VI secretion
VGRPAARVTDLVSHPLPPVLSPGPGSMNVLIGNLPAWRGVPAAAAAAIQSAKAVSDAAIQAAEAATLAAAGTPGAPAALAAEQATKATAAASMGSMISAAAGAADIHACATPLPVPPHGPGVIIDGSQTVLINGLPACRQGDTIIEAVGPPNKVAMGLPTVLIGDAGGGAGGLGAGAGAGAGASGGTGASAGAAADAVSADRAAREAARALHAKAQAAEPALTRTIQAASEGLGGEMIGLEHRLKTAESLQRKIATDMAKAGRSAERAAAGVWDAVRYTASFPPDKLVEGTEAVLGRLQQQGNEVVQLKNTWLEQSSYKGVNVQMRSPDGQMFEVQFHTPESFWAKEEGTHHLYELMRKLDRSSEEWARLNEEQMRITRQLQVPKGIERLRPVKKGS